MKKLKVSGLPFKRQPHKIAKHTQRIRRLLPTNCLSVFDPFVGLVLKRLTVNSGVYIFEFEHMKTINWTHFTPIFHFCTSWKRQQTSDFLKFSGGIKIEHLAKISRICYCWLWKYYLLDYRLQRNMTRGHPSST